MCDGIPDMSYFQALLTVYYRSTDDYIYRTGPLPVNAQGYVFQTGKHEGLLEGIHAPMFRNRHRLTGHRGHHFLFHGGGVGRADRLPAGEPPDSQIVYRA